MKWKPVEGNFTAYPNEIQEALHTTHLSPNESKILHFIIRKTFGWHKSTDQISQRQISNKTGLDRRTVRNVLERLKKRKILLNKPFVKGGRYKSPTLGVNANVNSWLRVGEILPPGGVGVVLSPGGRDTSPESGRGSTPYKRKKTLNKRKGNAKDGDGSSSALLGSNQNHAPLTEKQVLNNAKYLQKKRNRPGLVKAVEEAFKLGASPEQVHRRLSNENVHGGDLVQVIKQIIVTEGTDT